MLLMARYVLPVSSTHIENGAVLVRDDRIVEVGHAIELRRRYPTEEIRDFGLAALMPGFVDCHSHLEYSLMRGILNDVPYAAWKAYVMEKEALLTPQDWEDSAIMGAYEAISTGITTVADVTLTGASLRAASRLGLRGIIYREVGAASREQITPTMERAVADIESWRASDATGRFRFGLGPESLYVCHPEILGEVARYARQTGTPVAIHVAGSAEECDFIRYGSSPFAVDNDEFVAIERHQSTALLPTGCSPVRYALNWDILDAPEVLAVHCVKVDEADIAALAERDVRVCVCARANAKLGMGVAPIAAMRKAGIKVGLGTDSPAAADSIDPIEEMRFTMLVQRAINGKDGFITGPDMVRMATLDSAAALGMDDQVGSLEVGKLADIIAIDLSNSRQVPTHYPYSAVVHTADRDNVLMTMVGGQVVYDRQDPFSRVLTADVQAMRGILGNIEKIRSRLRS